MMIPPGTSSAACPAASGWERLAGTAAGGAAMVTGAWPRTTRTRRPMLSISSSARSWATASSTTCSGVHCGPAARRAARALPATGLARRRDAAQIVPAARVDLHDVPLVEEERDLDHRSRFERGRLVATGRRVAANARIGLDVLEVDDGVRLPVELDLQSLLEFRRGHLHGVMIPFVSGSWP